MPSLQILVFFPASPFELSDALTRFSPYEEDALRTACREHSPTKIFVHCNKAIVEKN